MCSLILTIFKLQRINGTAAAEICRSLAPRARRLFSRVIISGAISSSDILATFSRLGRLSQSALSPLSISISISSSGGANIWGILPAAACPADISISVWSFSSSCMASSSSSPCAMVFNISWANVGRSHSSPILEMIS